MPVDRPPFLIWMKHKLASVATRDVVNLASSSVKTDFAEAWKKEILSSHAAEVIERTAESHQFGLDSLKQAIRAAFGLPLEREIVITPGASGGIRLVCEVLLAGRSGAEVVVETPVYEPLRAIPARLGAAVVPINRRNDLNSLTKCLTPRTIAVFLTNLHNPTGDWMDYERLRGVCAVLDAAGSRALIVVDETFLDAGPQPATTAATLDPRIVTISSLSKSHGLPALRCGWVTADRTALPHFVDDAVLFQNIGFQLAEILGAMALERIDEFRTAARAHVAENRAVVSHWLRDMAAAHVIEPLDVPHGCIVFPKLQSGISTMSLGEELETRFGVLVAPGLYFGDDYDNHFRIGFGGDHESLQSGLARLADGLLALQQP